MRKLKYILPQLVKARQGWYIKYYQTNPKTGERERFRETYELNRISNKRERLKQAKIILADLYERIPLGYPFDEGVKVTLSNVNIIDALEMGLKMKSRSRKKTFQSYESKQRIFCNWLEEKKLKKINISELDSKILQKFLDWLLFIKGRTNTTHNNYIIYFKAILNELKKREYLSLNPAEGLKFLKEEEKRRERVGEQERERLLSFIQYRSPELHLIVLTVFYCFIRPGELRQLKRANFDFKLGVIRVPGTISKNKRNRVVTMPDTLRSLYLKLDYDKPPSHHYLFGAKLKHGANMCGVNHMNNVHRAALGAAVAAGVLVSATGLTLYSWKDSGGEFLVKSGVSVTEIQKQMGHAELSTTQRYISQVSDICKDIKGVSL